MSRRPNILIVMADQLSGTLFADGPAEFLYAPHLRALAERSRRFARCYAPSPLCTPARGGFMTGLLPSRSGIYDNAAEFPSTLPSFAHLLRAEGYDTALSGKMHFVGADQLHGFERRLTTDIYPADFGWTPDYKNPDQRIDWWYHNLSSVRDAGTAEISNQLEFDDEVAFHAEAELYRLARGDGRPWCLTVSFTHPHDPYVARPEFWNRYPDDADCYRPQVAPFDIDRHDPHSRRLLDAVDHQNYALSERHVAAARRAYFANISYLDQKIGRLLDQLDRCGLRDDTVVVLCADHGDMLGERGLWFKMSFLEPSARVPLLIAGPGIAPGRCDTPVSLLDLAPTLAELAGSRRVYRCALDGESLLPQLDGDEDRAPVLMEYAGEGSAAPLVAICERRYKYIHCELDPPQLFDLHDDPHELHNLAAAPQHAERARAFAAQVGERWNLARFDAEVRLSQTRRRLVYDAHAQGARPVWDYEPRQAAGERFMRNHKDLNVLERRARLSLSTAED